MDPRVYGGSRGQGPEQASQGAKGRQLEDSSGASQRGRQDNPFNTRVKQEDSYGGQKIKQVGQRKNQDDLFAQQRGKQEDLFAQKGKQEDFFAQREKQEDLFGAGGNNQKPETSVRVEEKSYEGSRQPFLGVDSQRGGEREGRDNNFGNFLSNNETEYSRPWNLQQPNVAGGIELHGDPSHEVSHNPAIQTMVKMVTMLNFMKVELGETKTLRSKEQWRAAGAEFVGTFLFVYIGCGSVVATGMLYAEMTPSRLVAIALAHGLAISCLAGATGAISGGHLNPAVTLAFVVAGKENLVRAGLYAGAQIFGAIFGALFLKFSTPEYLRGNLGSQDISQYIFTSQGFLVEMILTFALVFVIFGVAVDRRGPGVIAPLPIGFVVLVDHIVGVPYTGASMNPARSFGPALVSGYFGSAHLVYWVAPCFGASMAAALYRYAFLEPAEAAAHLAAIPP
ncbi:unnamed protein product [Calypogeia fissa]